MSYDYFERLDGVSKSRYIKKLEILDLKDCPYKLPAGFWKNNPKEWPDMEYGQLYNYLINSPGIFTRESMSNYKSLEARMYFHAGWVQTVFSYMLPGNQRCILRADVKPSQRMNDEPHRPWVALTKDGNIIAAHCNCMAGLSESCSHIAAILFKLEAAVRLGHTKTACTDEACKWNQDFVKKIGPDPISKIKFYKDKSVKRSKNRLRKNYKKQFAPSTPAEEKELLDALKQCETKPVVLSCFHGYADSFHWKVQPKANPRLPLPLSSLYNEESKQLDESELTSKCLDINQNLSISNDQIKYIYDITHDQSNSITWHEQRIGRVTSSTVHNVLRTNPENPAKSVILGICNPSRKQIHTDAIRWGKEHEKDGLRDYTQSMQTADPPHTNLNIEKCGLLISKEKPFLGASADAISSCNCHGRKVVEIKCPYSQREVDYKDFISNSDCCIANGKLKESHQYYSQVQLQMYVYNCFQCDFVIWTPKFTVVVFVPRNDVFIHNMVIKTENFFHKSILPELITRRIQQKSEHVNNNNNKEIKLYCVCSAPDDGRDVMIGCDNPNCQHQWYHLTCLKLKRAPKGKWICPKCKKQNTN